jgi:hypothetical protein
MSNPVQQLDHATVGAAVPAHPAAKDIGVLSFAGVVVGACLGAWVPYRRELGWLWGAGGGLIAFGGFGVCGHMLNRVGGRSLGWSAAGLVALPPAGALWLTVIADPRFDAPLGWIGGITGLVAGALCGSFLGTVAWRQDLMAGRNQKRADEMRATAVVLGLEFVFGLACAFVEFGIRRL